MYNGCYIFQYDDNDGLFTLMTIRWSSSAWTNDGWFYPHWIFLTGTYHRPASVENLVDRLVHRDAEYILSSLFLGRSSVQLSLSSFIFWSLVQVNNEYPLTTGMLDGVACWPGCSTCWPDDQLNGNGGDGDGILTIIWYRYCWCAFLLYFWIQLLL